MAHELLHSQLSIATDSSSSDVMMKQVNLKSAPHKTGGVKHRREPTKAVCRRNERERNRVRQVNLSFDRLRRHVPIPQESKNNSKKLSKVDTLRSAADYIQYLKNLLDSADVYLASSTFSSPSFVLGPQTMCGAIASPHGPHPDHPELDNNAPVYSATESDTSDVIGLNDVSWMAAVQAAAAASVTPTLSGQQSEFFQLNNISGVLPTTNFSGVLPTTNFSGVLPTTYDPSSFQHCLPSPTVSLSSDGSNSDGWSQSPSYYSRSGGGWSPDSETGAAGTSVENNYIYDGADFPASDESVRQCLLELTAWLMQ